MRDPDEGVDAAGRIVTGARRDRVPEAYEPILAAVSARIPDDVSLQLYGSVATGRARIGSSDIDLVAIGLPPAQAAEIGAGLSREHADVCRGVEIAAATAAEHAGDGDAAYGNRVFLRHYCVRLQGPDLASGLPTYAADVRAARGFNGDLGRQLATWRTLEPSAALGRRVARKTLLAVAGLVSVHDTTWTTDRDRAARRWGELEPDLADGLAGLLAWTGDDGQATASGVRTALGRGGVVARIDAAFAAEIGHWDA